MAKRGLPSLATYRPSDAPPGPMATASLTGHLPAIRGGLPLAKGEAPTGHRTGGAYGHTGAPAPHFPATYGQRGATPPTGHRLAS